MYVSPTSQIFSIIEDVAADSAEHQERIDIVRSYTGPLLIPKKDVGPFNMPLKSAGPTARKVNISL